MPPPGGNTAPTILSINAQQVAGQKFRIYGRVADNTPQTCGVVFTGAASGVATCDAAGNYDAVFNVANPGTVYAVAGDGQLQSGQSMYLLSNNNPTVGGFIAVGGENNAWTFSGTVGDEVPAGLSVSLAGPPGVHGATATVLANGTWSVTVTVAPGTSGMVTATATDWYGKTGKGYTSFGS